jgi:hypothetical protein
VPKREMGWGGVGWREEKENYCNMHFYCNGTSRYKVANTMQMLTQQPNILKGSSFYAVVKITTYMLLKN